MSDATMARVHVLIEGRVQGVGFRYFTRDIARRHKVKGWVRNVHDGTVEALFEGEAKDVESVLAQCYQGPPGSMVFNIKTHWQEYKGEQDSFSIKF